MAARKLKIQKETEKTWRDDGSRETSAAYESGFPITRRCIRVEAYSNIPGISRSPRAQLQENTDSVDGDGTVDIVFLRQGERGDRTEPERMNCLVVDELQAFVYTAGVGTAQGARIFDRSPAGTLTPHLDANGQPVLTRLNESTLRAVAEAGGGNYRLVGPTSDTLLDLRIDLRRLDPTPIGDERLVIPVERYQLFLGAALVLLVLSWFLPARLALPSLVRVRAARPQPGLALLLVALLVGACGSSDTLRGQNRDANRLYEAGDFEGALAAYQELLAERPDVAELSYNAGNTLHRLGNYERAIDETQRGLPPDEVQLGVATYFALGNHLLQLGRFEEAYAAYRAALLLDRTDLDSKHNLEIALLALNGVIEPGGPGDQGQTDGTPEPGEGTPQPGEGTPQVGEGTPQPGSSPQPGSGSGTPNPTPGSAESFQRTLEEALKGIDEDLTFEEAIAILDLLRQQQQTPRSPGFGASGPDY